MEKSINSFIWPIITIFILSACTTTKWTVVKNNTDKNLTVNLFIVNKHGEHETETYLKPDESDMWEYHQSSFNTAKVNEDLNKIQVISESGCLITYDRDAIEQRVPDESWLFNIEQQDLTDACAALDK